MYVWVVLATFLAMIAAYVLPIRPDTEKSVVVPVAQAKLVQLAAKQKAGEQHILENSWPIYSGATELNRNVGFINGEVDVTPYLNRVGVVNNTKFVTAIYCLTDDKSALRTGDQHCRKDFEDTFERVLITYGPIPEKWRRYVENGTDFASSPSNDMMNAFRYHYTEYDIAGYAIREGGKYYIVNYEGTKFEVPKVVGDNTGMSHYGLGECIDDNNGSCLAHMKLK